MKTLTIQTHSAEQRIKFLRRQGRHDTEFQDFLFFDESQNCFLIITLCLKTMKFNYKLLLIKSPTPKQFSILEFMISQIESITLFFESFDTFHYKIKSEDTIEELEAFCSNSASSHEISPGKSKYKLHQYYDESRQQIVEKLFIEYNESEEYLYIIDLTSGFCKDFELGWTTKGKTLAWTVSQDHIIFMKS